MFLPTDEERSQYYSRVVTGMLGFCSLVVTQLCFADLQKSDWLLWALYLFSALVPLWSAMWFVLSFEDLNCYLIESNFVPYRSAVFIWVVVQVLGLATLGGLAMLIAAAAPKAAILFLSLVVAGFVLIVCTGLLSDRDTAEFIRRQREADERYRQMLEAENAPTLRS